MSVRDLNKEIADLQSTLNSIGKQQDTTREQIQKIETIQKNINNIQKDIQSSIKSKEAIKQHQQNIKQIQQEIKQDPLFKVAKKVKVAPDVPFYLTPTVKEESKGLDPTDLFIEASDFIKDYYLSDYSIAGTLRKNVARGLTALGKYTNEFESKSGYPSRKDFNKFLEENPDLTGFQAKHQYQRQVAGPDNLSEAVNRILFMGTSITKGAIRDFYFPVSWNVSPPTSERQLAGEIIGGVFTPDPASTMLVKTFRDLGVTKKGKKLLGKIVNGIDLSSDEYKQFKKLSPGNTLTLEDLKNVDDVLTAVGTKNVDELAEVARKQDVVMDAMKLGKRNAWSEGIDLNKVASISEQRKAIREVKGFIQEMNDILKRLDDIDPDTGKTTYWGLMSPYDKRRQIDSWKKLLKFWDDNPEIFTAGASYQPPKYLLEQAIKDLHTDPDALIDFIEAHGDMYIGLSPNTLLLMEDLLNEPIDFEGTPKPISDSVLDQENDDLNEINNEIIDNLDKQDQDLDEKEDLITKTTTITKPKDEDEESIRRKETHGRKPKFPSVKFNVKHGKYKVRYQYTTSAQEVKTVKAKSYIDAMNKANNTRLNKAEILQIDLEFLGVS